MSDTPAPSTGMHTVDVAEVERISAISDPIVRNLEITYCYSRLSVAMAARTGSGANWCTFATWASRQAGATIRGEDLLDTLRRRLDAPAEVRHPIRSLWRFLLRRGWFQPATRIGSLVRALHTPLDVLERTSDAVARGNLKVFAEIGREFARYLAECPPDAAPEGEVFGRFVQGLRPGEPPDGQRHLRQAFTRYQRQRLESEASPRAELMALANLEIGLHEQTRLQEEIRESLDAPMATYVDLRRRVLERVVPRSGIGRQLARGPVTWVLVRGAAALNRFAAQLSRQVITECLMVLSLPDGVALSLGRHIEQPSADSLQGRTDREFAEFIARFETCPSARDLCRASDWSDLTQRMHYILHLFCAFHERRDLFSPPFAPDQVAAFRSGRLPDGPL